MPWTFSLPLSHSLTHSRNENFYLTSVDAKIFIFAFSFAFYLNLTPNQLCMVAGYLLNPFAIQFEFRMLTKNLITKWNQWPTTTTVHQSEWISDKWKLRVIKSIKQGNPKIEIMNENGENSMEFLLMHRMFYVLVWFVRLNRTLMKLSLIYSECANQGPLGLDFYLWYREMEKCFAIFFFRTNPFFPFLLFTFDMIRVKQKLEISLIQIWLKPFVCVPLHRSLYLTIPMLTCFSFYST